MKIQYALSKDFDKLYDLICEGNTVVGFVDYKFQLDGKVFRDVCKITRYKENNINIGARGMRYGSVDDFDLYLDTHTERSVFISVCIYCNLEWIII